MITFLRRKNDCLNKEDKSSIGCWDKKIIDLCNKINEKENYYTLSSCSGRIVLIKNFEKKQAGMFIFRSHKKVKLQELKRMLNKLKKSKESLIFKQEPPIVHVCCKTIKDAETILEKARNAGWKNSGIISLKKRIISELRSTESLSFPIMNRGKLLVNNDFLKIAINESNNKLIRGWKKIKKLENLF